MRILINNTKLWFLRNSFETIMKYQKYNKQITVSQLLFNISI